MRYNSPAMQPKPTSAITPAAANLANGVFFRARQDVESLALDATIDAALKSYFQNLGGISPSIDMYNKIMLQVEKPLILNVLKYVRGNQVRAAHILGINRNTLRKKITTLEIDLESLQ